MDLSPSEIQKRLAGVLGEYDDRAKLVHRQESLPLQNGIVEPVDEHRTIHKPKEGWLHFRQREGTLNRVPNGFYPSVWNLLKHCKGLIIGDKLDIRNRIESHLVLSEMTAGEKNFALWIEHLLNKMDAAKYRQINVETLIELSALARRSPSLFIDDYLVLDVIIGHAVRLAWLNDHPDRASDYEEDKPHAWTSFYESSPPACSSYVVKAVQLLTSGEVTD
jgi:phosphorylase kinase alpha/beta subunit